MIDTQKLAIERKRLKITQQQVAEHMGVGQTAVSNWELGLRGLDASSLYQILSFLRDKGSKITIDDLFIATSNQQIN